MEYSFVARKFLCWNCSKVFPILWQIPNSVWCLIEKETMSLLGNSAVFQVVIKSIESFPYWNFFAFKQWTWFILKLFYTKNAFSLIEAHCVKMLHAFEVLFSFFYRGKLPSSGAYFTNQQGGLKLWGASWEGGLENVLAKKGVECRIYKLKGKWFKSAPRNKKHLPPFHEH